MSAPSFTLLNSGPEPAAVDQCAPSSVSQILMPCATSTRSPAVTTRTVAMGVPEGTSPLVARPRGHGRAQGDHGQRDHEQRARGPRHRGRTAPPALPARALDGGQRHGRGVTSWAASANTSRSRSDSADGRGNLR
ncbi:hypothetical protein O1M63_19615 [Streptomyces mirabilis]|nr:hypothetical protein [Streptomyces mirabilis]